MRTQSARAALCSANEEGGGAGWGTGGGGETRTRGGTGLSLMSVASHLQRPTTVPLPADGSTPRRRGTGEPGQAVGSGLVTKLKVRPDSGSLSAAPVALFQVSSEPVSPVRCACERRAGESAGILCSRSHRAPCMTLLPRRAKGTCAMRRIELKLNLKACINLCVVSLFPCPCGRSRVP